MIKKHRRSRQEKMAQKVLALEETVRPEGLKLLQVIDQTIARYQDIPQGRKLYSLHESQVTCIRKGKRSKPDEYGSKVALWVDRSGYVAGHQEYPDNRHDYEDTGGCLHGLEASVGSSVLGAWHGSRLS